ncbi:MAG: response regulator [Polyangiaceae bacterium]|nr:response regulator [Polyangiaceae bacterium]
MSPKDAASMLRALAARLDAPEVGAPEADVAQFVDALDALLVRASRYLPHPAAPGAEPESVRRSVYDQVLERSLRITQQSVDGAPIAIFRIDGEGRIIGTNRAAQEALGYSLEEMLRLTIFDIDADFTPELWKKHRAMTRPTGSRTFAARQRRKDGTIFPVEVHVQQFVFEGELYSVSFAKDISERVHAEQERRKLEARMLQAQKLESLGVLAGGIAHDFNNLLMVIIGNLDLALTGSASMPSERPLLLDADQAARQGADLCRQLLVYAGKGASQVEPVDLGALLREQAKMLEVSASKSVRLVLSLAGTLPKIQADVSQLRQVMMNLIINASDAMGDAPGVITLSTSVMDCDQEYLDSAGIAEPLKPGRYVCVEVTDTGCGMTEEVRQKIFDPFFSTKTQSRGLGLAAVRGIVNNHGGGIRVYSELGRGTTFKLLFPVPCALASLLPKAPTSAAWQGHGLVLLVDDEEPLRVLGRRMLARLGFETLVAANGAEGLDLFRQHRDRIRYVLLDWTMPEMGGSETFSELRQIDPNVRVILTSGHAPEDVMRRLVGKPVTAFVRKPYNIAELCEAFQAASRESAAAATAAK